MKKATLWTLFGQARKPSFQSATLNGLPVRLLARTPTLSRDNANSPCFRGWVD